MTSQTNTSADLLDSKTSAYAISYAITAIFNGILVLLKEMIPGVHDIMAAAGHHWVTHGVLVLIVFFGVGMSLSKGRQISSGAAVAYVVWGTIIGGGIIALFNLINTL